LGVFVFFYREDAKITKNAKGVVMGNFINCCTNKDLGRKKGCPRTISRTALAPFVFSKLKF
jgi:hypothetical protein